MPTRFRYARPHALAIACSLVGGAAWAQGEAPSELSAVEVKGQSTAAVSAAFSATRQDADEIREQRVQQVQQLFRNVPGMNLNGLGLTGVADNVVLRGFGAGGHGGDVGFVVDGIALNEAMSHADGYADLNVIIPLELEDMTVLRGPVSALYGAYNRAGVVALRTRRGGRYLDADFAAGSRGTLDAQLAGGFEIDDRQHLNLAAQAYRSDGFRPQSGGERYTLSGRYALKATPDLEVAISGRAHRATADNPGYLSAAQFHADPYGIDPRMKNDGAKKNFDTLRADLNYRLGPALKLLSYLYATRQDFTRWFTRGGEAAATWSQREETYQRDVIGAGFNLNGRHDTGLGALSWVAGLETIRERTDYLKYENTDFRRRVGTADYDRRFTLNNVAAFAEAGLPMHRLFQPTLGLRYDRFTGDCRRSGPELMTDPCGGLPVADHTSPKIGVRSQVSERVQLRASWTEGFALANEMAKYALGDSRVSPNVFRQAEIGANLKLARSLTVDVAAYRLRSSDEIGMIAPGEYVNSGSTRRTGIEIAALWAPMPVFDLSITYGSANSRILGNVDPTLVGKRVTAVPRMTSTISANWRPVAGWQGTVVWRRVGDYAVDERNTETYPGYQRWDLGVSYTFAGPRPITVYAAIDNLADRRYATQVGAVGYATGAPRMFRVGTQLHF
ncbi:MAG: TonB-dependent receptor [Burkholderiaceae bacterium]